MSVMTLMGIQLPDNTEIKMVEVFNHIEVMNLSDVEAQLTAIDDVMHDVRALEQVRHVLERVKNPSRETLGFAVQATHGIAKGLTSPKLTSGISLESDDRERLYEVVLEGLGDTVQRIWDAIQRTIKYVWDKIMSWIGMGGANVKSLDAQVEAANANVKKTQTLLLEAKKEASKDNRLGQVMDDIASGKNMRIIDDENLNRAFIHLNTQVVDSQVLREAEKLIPLGARLIDLVGDIQTVHERLRHGLEQVDADDVHYIIQHGEVLKEISGAFVFEELRDEIYKHASKTHDQHFDAGIIRDFFTFEGRELDEASIRSIDGFAFGGRVFFFTSTDEADGNIYVLAADKIFEPEDQKVEIKYMGNDAMRELGHILAKVSDQATRMTKLYGASYGAIKTHHSIIIKMMTAVIGAVRKTNGGPEAEAAFVYVQEMTRAILRLASEMAKANAMYLTTVQAFTTLMRMSSSEHARVLTEAKAEIGVA